MFSTILRLDRPLGAARSTPLHTHAAADLPFEPFVDVVGAIQCSVGKSQ